MIFLSGLLFLIALTALTKKYWQAWSFIAAVLWLAFYSVSWGFSYVMLAPAIGTLFTHPVFGKINYRIDMLSVLLLCLINLQVVVVAWFSFNSLNKLKLEVAEITLHRLSLIVLQIALLGVVVLDHIPYFLMLWELMSLSSFLLLITRQKDEAPLKAGLQYLAQMQFGFLCLLAGFLWFNYETSQYSFADLALYWKESHNFMLFLLFFVGFAVKAGLIPFHTWVPEADASAPGHIGALMSSIMVKMGIYGIFRLSMMLDGNLYSIAIMLLIIGMLSALYGILQATLQKVLLRILAYSTIENIGLITLALGLGLIGKATNRPVVAQIGFLAALLHLINHSLIKSMLFLSSTVIVFETGTKNINELGGVIKKLPYTSFFLIVGSLAIAGLPPLNGFVSEWMIFIGFLKGLQINELSFDAILMVGLIAFCLTGGISSFAFMRLIGIGILGNSRNASTQIAISKLPLSALIPLSVLLLSILSIAIVPSWFIEYLKPSTLLWHTIASSNTLEATTNIHKESLLAAALMLFAFIIWSIRYFNLQKRTIQYQNTWGCGYSNITPKMQYTGFSFTSTLSELVGGIFSLRRKYPKIHPNNIYPQNHNHKIIIQERFQTFIFFITHEIIRGLRFLTKPIIRVKYAQQYVVYILIFIFMLLVTTFFPNLKQLISR